MLASSGCKLQKDFPPSSATATTGPWQRAGGAAWCHRRARASTVSVTPAKPPPRGRGDMRQQLPRWHCGSACALRAALSLACVAVLARLLAGDMDSALIMSKPGQRGRSGVCTHVRGVLGGHSCVSVSARSPHCVRRAPGGSSCPVLHIVGLAGLFPGVRSVCRPKRLSRHGVKLSSFKSHSARGGSHKPRRGLINKTFSLREG